MAIALATSTGAANAAVVTFTVDESVVSGSNPDTFQANGLTSKYLERVTLNTATGEFSGNLVVAFTQYTNSGSFVGEQLSATPRPLGEGATANRYAMYALVSVNGTFTAEARPNDRTLFSFILENGTANVFLDPDRNTTKDLDLNTANDADDEHILTASTIDTDVTESFGLVLVRNSNDTVVTGAFALVFTDPALVGIGPLYWPTLNGLLFHATASGDLDPPSECANCTFPSAIAGDASIAFQAVPEPASMSLLGLGLLGTSFALRRRRQRQAD